jgi:hypothetical protein
MSRVHHLDPARSDRSVLASLRTADLFPRIRHDIRVIKSSSRPIVPEGQASATNGVRFVCITLTYRDMAPAREITKCTSSRARVSFRPRPGISFRRVIVAMLFTDFSKAGCAI